MTSERKSELRTKQIMVERCGRTLWDTQATSVKSADYEVYSRIDDSVDCQMEFLVVNFIGGGKCVRNCTGTSITGIFREFGKLADGGYYDELEFYDSIRNSPNYMVASLI